MRSAWLFVFLSACQCQSKAPTGASGSGTGSASGSTTPAKKKSTLDITLPPVSGKPPKQSPTLTADRADALATRTFDDFSLEVTKGNNGVAIRQRAKTEPGMSVNIFLAPCSEKYKCRPMTVEAWKADEAVLKKQLLDPDLIDRPGTIFEIGPAAIAGTPAIAIYEAGYFYGKDDNGNPASAQSLAYSLFYNDDKNYLRVTVNYSGEPTSSLAELQKTLPRPFMEKVALAFADYYGQNW